MEFTFTNEELQLRAEVQEFIAENLSDELREELKQEGRGTGPLAEDFFQKIMARGWTAVTWPREYGGQGGSPMTQFIIEEEFQRAGFQRIGGGGTGAPAILASGTEEQKRQYVPATIRGEIIFAQGYSEPGCGTDLAGIQCRATRQGDRYIVNGQKVYTTAAHVATHIFLMVRTDPASKRQNGLSILLVPMDTPGITVRPLWTIQNEPRAPTGTTYGEPRTNEVFFDNVEAPVSCLLGQEGDGWAVARRGLNLDRVGARRYLISVMRDEDIVNWLKADGEPNARLRQDDRVRDKVAELWTEAQVCRLMTMRSMSIVQRGGNFTYEGSAEKVWAPEHGVRATEAISQILGPAAQLLNGSPHTIEDGVFAHNLLGAFQSTVNHGSVQVMRDQIARNGLGLPRARR
jgi:alkylation response protein AidB-like acyl-CoA dehydrogenase